MSVNLDILRVVEEGKVDRASSRLGQVHWVVVVLIMVTELVYLIRVVVHMQGMMVF
jgi:hypothetical protein